MLAALTGFIYIISSSIALVYLYWQPGQANWWYGYRTPRSMKNPENWSYANKLAARYMLYLSQIHLVFSTLLILLFRNSMPFVVLMPAMLLSLAVGYIILIILVESSLARFEKNRQGKLNR